MSIVIDILSWFLLLGGSVVVVIGAFGLIRMPDFYTRLHPAGVTDTLGAGMILLGLILQVGFSLIAVKLLMIILLLFFTSPTSSHATARAAMADGLKPLLFNKPKADDNNRDDNK
jgi:multicomponent Na+:H+ antiporter subunit G